MGGRYRTMGQGRRPQLLGHDGRRATKHPSCEISFYRDNLGPPGRRLPILGRGPIPNIIHTLQVGSGAKLDLSTTICTCIEAGELETQVLLLAESFRRFGGRWADVSIVAVKPRRGPALATGTIKRLNQLDVRLVDRVLNDEAPWWNMANKAAAMRYVEQHASTSYVTWMDGDMVVLREPQEFAPARGTEFIARAGEAYDVASSGSDDKADYWHRICAVFGLKFEEFENIISWPDCKSIKSYWQGGLFTYPKDIKFGERHYDVYAKMLRTPIASKYAGTYHQDQISLALTVQLLKLRCSQYNPRMNFNYNPIDKEAAKLIPLEELYVLHYHSSLWPYEYGWAREGFKALSADRFMLIDSHAPLSRGSTIVRLQRKLLRQWRKRKLNAFEASVVRY